MGECRNGPVTALPGTVPGHAVGAGLPGALKGGTWASGGIPVGWPPDGGAAGLTDGR